MLRSLSLPALLALGLPVALFTACADAEPLGPPAVTVEAAAPNRAATNTTRRPLQQRSWGTLRPVGPCSGGITFEASGRGVASHVGRFAIQLRWCMNPATGQILAGTVAVTGANGERIDMSLGGRAPSPVRLSMRATIVGGTGRFAGSSGHLDVDVSLGGAGRWASKGEGWIAY